MCEIYIPIIYVRVLVAIASLFMHMVTYTL